MGEVYQATDSRLGRTVAIKILPAHLADSPEFRERFEREARAISALNPPNIAALYDIGREGNTDFLVLEYLEGETLAARLAKGRLRLSDALSIAIEGQVADARTDIFAFGMVLFEMLAGRRAFEGTSPASTMGAILRDEPPTVSTIEPMASPALDHLVRTCLAKDPDARFQTARDVLIQLKWIASGGSGVGLPAPVLARRRFRERAAWMAAAVLGLIAVALAVVTWRQLGHVDTPGLVTQFDVDPPAGWRWTSPPVVSPDGRHLVMAFDSADGTASLWLRPLDVDAPRRLEGTDGPNSPFWSADNRQVAFFARGDLKTVDIETGTVAVLLAGAGTGVSGAWSHSGDILFSTSESRGLRRLHVKDGHASEMAPATTAAEGAHHTVVQFLPDGQRYLFLATGPTPPAALRVGRLDSDAAPVIDGVSEQAFFAEGHLFFTRGRSIMVRPMDADSAALMGEAQVLRTSTSMVSVSPTGVLTYVKLLPPESGAADLLWRDRRGAELGRVGSSRRYNNLSLSPDGRRLAVSQSGSGGPSSDIWILDLTRAGAGSALVTNGGNAVDPTWSGDGKWITYGTVLAGSPYRLQRIAADFSSRPEDLLPDWQQPAVQPDLSRDGRYLVFASRTGANKQTIWKVDMATKDQPVALREGAFMDREPTLSPDGRWLAYDSNRSGRWEVYVQPFPNTGPEYPVSVGGGWGPRWRGDGKELFFLSLTGTMMAATIETTSEFKPGVPQPLFDTGVELMGNLRAYDVTADGERFIYIKPQIGFDARRAGVIVNWPGLLRPSAGTR